VQRLDDTNELVVALDLWAVGQVGPLLPGVQKPARRSRLVAGLARLRNGPSPVLRAAAMLPSLKFHPGIQLSFAPAPVTELNAPTRELADEMIRRLNDPAPCVRGTAALIIGMLRDRRAVPRLVELLDDTAEGNLMIGGVRLLASGEPVTLPLMVAGFGEPPTVAMAALNALRMLSLAGGAEYERRIECDTPASDFETCAQRAREWAKRVR
jgi:hypothetical protein